MHGGEADVLVHTAIAGDVVRVEQLIVVGEIVSESISRLRIADVAVGVGLKHAGGVFDRRGVVRNVDQELVPGAHNDGGRVSRNWIVEIDGRTWGARHKRGHVVDGAGKSVWTIVKPHNDLRKAGRRVLDEVAVSVSGQQRNVAYVSVGQSDTKEIARLRLDDGPGCHAADQGVGVRASPPEM